VGSSAAGLWGPIAQFPAPLGHGAAPRPPIGLNGLVLKRRTG